MTIEQIITVVVTVFGGGAGIALLAKRIIDSLIEKIRAETRMALAKVETETKQDDTITNFSIEFNAERKQLQQSINHLSAENLEIKLKQAEVTGDYAGRLAEIKESMQRERDEWKLERLANDEKFRLMALDISELKQHREQSTRRITELESQKIEIERKLATAIANISLLQAQKRELESLLEKERNRADSLNSLVERLQAPTLSTTQAIPDVDETVITDPQPQDTVTPVTDATNDNEETNAA